MSKLSKFINVLVFIILLLLLISIFLLRGIVSVLAWLGTLFIIPILGVGFCIGSLIILLYKFRKKKGCTGITITLILSLIMLSPILILMNIVSIPYPNDINKAKPVITVNWPFKEKTVVGAGGNSVKSNGPHIMIPAERWAYDLVMEPYGIGSEVLEDYGIFNKEVLAPISGTIVKAYDGENDIKANSEEYESTLGNYIYLKIEETGTYLFLGHLKKGSLTVKTGDYVTVGQVLGRVGNSGTSSEPHLHIHHQRQGPDEIIHPIAAEGLPLYFKDINGSPMPLKGERVYKLGQ